MKTMLIKLSKIVTTAGTQIRASIDTDTVDEYATLMLDATNKFPPIVVYHDGSQYILADGFHRVMAASRNGFKDIEADIRKGTHSDALKFALGANSAHGLKRSNADKRRSVDLALSEWPKMSDREIAKVCAVSQPFVSEYRTDNGYQSETRIGADGRECKLPKKKTLAGGMVSEESSERLIGSEEPDGKWIPEVAAHETTPPAIVPDKSKTQIIVEHLRAIITDLEACESGDDWGTEDYETIAARLSQAANDVLELE